MTVAEYAAITAIRDVVTGRRQTHEAVVLALDELAALESLADAAQHYLNGADEDGWINLRETLARVRDGAA